MNNFNPLFEKLAVKTRAGKLVWQETAQEGTFIVAVDGRMTFRFESLCKLGGQQVDAVLLEIRGEVGQILTRIVSLEPVAKVAYYSARRSQPVHMKVDEAIQLLESL